MPLFDLLGWILLGLLAGSISGWFVRGTRSVQGCLPTMVVGMIGGVIGGWIVRGIGNEPVQGFIGALVFATISPPEARPAMRDASWTPLPR